jgi:hypothetical protein
MPSAGGVGVCNDRRLALNEDATVHPDPADLTLPETDRRELILWTVSCAERLLPIFESERPDDRRLREGLAGALAFSRGELSIGAVRRLASGCHAAAREVEDAAATAAARACGQAVAVAHMAGHSRQVAKYTAKALAADHKRSDYELDWQRKRGSAAVRWLRVLGLIEVLPGAMAFGNGTASDDDLRRRVIECRLAIARRDGVAGGAAGPASRIGT